MIPRHQYRIDHAAEWEAAERRLDRLIDVARSVRRGDRLLLVGPNGSGKSLLRGLIGPPGKGSRMVHASMAVRTGSNPAMGALSHMFADAEGSATSVSSLSLLGRILDGCAKLETPYSLHIDEPEVGCGEETRASLGPWLRGRLDTLSPVVTLVTTHCRHMAAHFGDYRFVDAGGEFGDLSSWLARTIVPTDLEKLQRECRTMYLVVVERQEARKSKN